MSLSLKAVAVAKRIATFFMAVALMTVAIPQLHTVVYADELIPAKQFATADDLRAFNTNDGAKNAAKVYFGSNNQQWWIAGSQNGNLILFAASPLEDAKPFEPDINKDKSYEDDWGCYYSGSEP